MRCILGCCFVVSYCLFFGTCSAAMNPPDPETYQRRLVIVGGGLAGLSTALEASRQWEGTNPGRPFEIVVLDKENRLGGNSVKASSGINAIDTTEPDAVASFIEDTRRSGGGLSDEDLIQTLVTQSGAAIKFLGTFGVDLSGLTQLGGHSTSRTRFNPTGSNVGFAIMQKLMAAVEADPKIHIMKDAKVTSIELLSNRYPSYDVHFSSSTGHGTVKTRAFVMATGGFGANKELLKKFAPQTAPYATTNGPWSTGDGLELGKKLGTRLVHLEEVQLHPTGFVDPKDPDAGSKILAAEKLRGCGAILLNMEGHRFVDELNQRDHVYDKLSKQTGEKAWLLLSAAGGEKFDVSRMGFYFGRGLIKTLDSIDGISEHTNIPAATLKHELETYNAASKTNKDAFGKTTFPTDFDTNGPFYVAMITPVVHYTMGGLRINSNSQVLKEEGEGATIAGVYAAGEVSGGLHGKNRLGGNSLLDCVVFGRQAANHAIHYIAQTNVHEEL